MIVHTTGACSRIIRLLLLKVCLPVVFIVLMLPSVVYAAADEKGAGERRFVNEIGIGFGHNTGSQNYGYDNISVFPLFARVGISLNHLVGLTGKKSTLQLAVEPFFNAIDGSQKGEEVGCGIGLRYFHGVSGAMDLFIDAQAAPMFLSINTFRQGAAGFNFLDQFGAGVQYRCSARTAVFTGYRFRHISHAGLVERPNAGINSHVIVAGVSLLY